jgi:hypothetical protein
MKRLFFKPAAQINLHIFQWETLVLFSLKLESVSVYETGRNSPFWLQHLTFLCFITILCCYNKKYYKFLSRYIVKDCKRHIQHMEVSNYVKMWQIWLFFVLKYGIFKMLNISCLKSQNIVFIYIACFYTRYCVSRISELFQNI